MAGAGFIVAGAEFMLTGDGIFFCVWPVNSTLFTIIFLLEVLEQIDFFFDICQAPKIFLYIKDNFHQS